MPPSEVQHLTITLQYPLLTLSEANHTVWISMQFISGYVQLSKNRNTSLVSLQIECAETPTFIKNLVWEIM